MYYISGKGICQPLFSAFFKKLPDGGIDGLFTQESDDQPVGQAYDVRAAVAETPLHAVVIRAVGPGDSDLAVFDGDGVLAVHGEFLVDGQVHGFDLPATGGDPGKPGLLRAQQGKAQKKTGGGHRAEKHDPEFRFHGYHSSETNVGNGYGRSAVYMTASYGCGRNEEAPWPFHTVTILFDSIPKNLENSKKKLKIILDICKQPC